MIFIRFSVYGFACSLLLVLPSARAATEQVDFGSAVAAEVDKRASGDNLWIDRFSPPGHDPQRDRRPAAVFFFGGGWTHGTVRQFEQHARYLASRGMVAFVADYRVQSRQGWGHERVKPWFPTISPAHNISADDPPTIVFLGTADALISSATAEQCDARLRAAGVCSELWIYEGQPHGFFNESKSQRCFIDTVLKVNTFLVSLGWLEGQAHRQTLRTLLRSPPALPNIVVVVCDDLGFGDVQCLSPREGKIPTAILSKQGHHASGPYRGSKADVVVDDLPAGGAEDSVSFLGCLLGSRGELADRGIIHHSISGHFAYRRGRWKLLLARGSGGWSRPREKDAATHGAWRSRSRNTTRK